MLYAIGSFKDVAHLSARGNLRTLLTFIARLEIREHSVLYQCDLILPLQADMYCRRILCDADASAGIHLNETA